MAIRNLTQRNALANAYATAAPYGALFTADPGTADAATNEVTGGAPAYARKNMTWGAASNSVITSAATTFDVPSGVTPAWFGVCVSSVKTTADVRDSYDIVDQGFSSQGTFVVTATYTQA